MADKKIGGISVYKDDDGKAVWEFEGKIQSDIPLDTDAQDFAGAINELKKLSAEGGGENYTKPWTRPPDWPALPAPNDNQVIFLVTTALNSSPYCSIQTRPLDKYAFPENNGEYPEDLTINISWGDGNTSTAVRRNEHSLEWTNSFGQNGPTANNPTVGVHSENYYFNYTGQFGSPEAKRFWNSGGTRLDDGSMVFIITVTVSDPQNVVIEFPINSYSLEMHIGRNINISKNQGGFSQNVLQHVKAFGWQPGNNRDKRYSSYNSNTGTIYWKGLILWQKQTM